MKNPISFRRLIPQIPSFSSYASQDLVGVDFSGDRVRLVHAREFKDKRVIESVLERRIPEGADDAISAFLASSFESLKIRTREAVCVVPASAFISKNVDMPSNDREEIGKIIELQAGRYTPYSREEIVIDYLCMTLPGQHYTNVLLLIMNRQVVSRYYGLLERAGIEVARMAIASEGMGITYDEISKWKPEGEAVGGVHIGETAADFSIVDRHQMVFVRSLPIGAAQFRGNPEAAQADFLSELNKSMMAYQDQGVGRPLRGLVIAGLIEELGHLEEGIRKAVPLLESATVPIKMINYATYFDMSDAALQVLEASRDVSFFEVMAPLMHLKRLEIDLMPKEMKLKRRFREGGRDMMTLGILIMSAFVVFSFFLISKIYLRHRHIGKLDEANQATYDQARFLERVSTKSRLLRNLLDARGKGLYVFERVTSLIGEDISLVHFGYESDGDVALTGTAESMSRVFAFVTELEESNYFQEVKTKSTKSRREGAKEVADFEIECLLAEGI